MFRPTAVTVLTESISASMSNGATFEQAYRIGMAAITATDPKATNRLADGRCLAHQGA